MDRQLDLRRSTPEEQALVILRQHGAPEDYVLPLDDEGRVDLLALARSLPEDSEARVAVLGYVQALDPRLRVRGVSLSVRRLVTLLMERLNYLEYLASSVVRVCNGQQCPHYAVCPFAEQVSHLTGSEGVYCAVERELVGYHLELFTSRRGRRPLVDTDRPEQVFMLQQLLQLLVQQKRYAMYMQRENIKIPVLDKRRLPDGSEELVVVGDAEHPLAQAWQRVTREISRLMAEMGCTPAFMQRWGLLDEESERVDAEARARELVLDVYQNLRDYFGEDSDVARLLDEAIEAFRQEDGE